jgi:hypothetical protein
VKTEATAITGTSSSDCPGALIRPRFLLYVSHAHKGVVDGESTRIQNVNPPSLSRGPRLVLLSRS